MVIATIVTTCSNQDSSEMTYRPNSVTFNILIKRYLKAGKSKEAIDLLFMIHQQGESAYAIIFSWICCTRKRHRHS